MSGRPVADVVAEARELPRTQTPAEREVIDLIERLDTLRPPCPTCRERRYPFDHDSIAYGEVDCPACVDGKVSWEQMAATYRAVWDDDLRDRVSIVGCSSVLNYLRSVKP